MLDKTSIVQWIGKVDAYIITDSIVLLASSGTLAIIMGLRTYKSRKFMPAGLTAALRYSTEVQSVC